MSFKLYKEEEPQEPFKRIDVEEARRLLDQGDVQLIDVREPDEWEGGHAPEARHVPLQTFLSDPSKYVQPTDKVIFTCAVGVRSAVAAEMASAVGVDQVYNLEGGFNAWKEKGYPVERPGD